MAIAAALSRSIGLALVVSTFALLAFERRWRALAIFSTAAALTVGSWLLWTVRAPRLDAGRSYVADALYVPSDSAADASAASDSAAVRRAASRRRARGCAEWRRVHAARRGANASFVRSGYAHTPSPTPATRARRGPIPPRPFCAERLLLPTRLARGTTPRPLDCRRPRGFSRTRCPARGGGARGAGRRARGGRTRRSRRARRTHARRSRAAQRSRLSHA